MPDGEFLAYRTRLGVLQHLAKTNTALDEEYGAAVKRLEDRLKKIRTGTIPKAVAREMRQLTDKAYGIVRRSIETGAVTGSEHAKQEFLRVFGNSPTTAGRPMRAEWRELGKGDVIQFKGAERTVRRTEVLGSKMRIEFDDGVATEQFAGRKIDLLASDFGGEAKPFDVRVPPPTPPTLSKVELNGLVAERLRGKVYVDKVPVSERLWQNNLKQGRRLARDVQATIRAGGSISEAADRIVGYTDHDWNKTPPSIRVPKYIREIEQAARRAAITGEPNAVTEVVSKHRAQIDKLGQTPDGFAYSVRSPVRQLINDLKGATDEQIDARIQRYVTDRARVHARMIARTETINAYRESYRESVKDEPWVGGIKWNLSPRHPVPDICDVWANEDLHGLGPGGYPLDETPEGHPNCLCFQTTLHDKDYFKREIAKRKDEEPPPPPEWKTDKPQPAGSWLKKQPAETQKKILGPTRYAAFKEQPSSVFSNAQRAPTLKRVRDVDFKLKPVPTATAATAKTQQPPESMYRDVLREADQIYPEEARKRTADYGAENASAIIPKNANLQTTERHIVNGKFEHMAAFDENDDLMLRFTSRGRTSVSMSDDTVSVIGRLRPSTITHNHPSDLPHSATLSYGDLVSAARMRIKTQLRAVTKNHGGSRMVITDEAKWSRTFPGANQEQKFKDAVLKAKLDIEDMAREDLFSHAKGHQFMVGPDGAFKTRDARDAFQMNAAAKHAKRIYNKVGQRFGFRYETF